MEFTPAQLKEFKKEAVRVLKMYESLAKYFNIPIVTTCEVLIQNLAFDGSNAVNYSHDKAVEKVNEVREILRGIKEYNDFYLTRLAFEEVDNIFISISFSDF